jgi:hypothetical protein
VFPANIFGHTVYSIRTCGIFECAIGVLGIAIFIDDFQEVVKS